MLAAESAVVRKFSHFLRPRMQEEVAQPMLTQHPEVSSSEDSAPPSPKK